MFTSKEHLHFNLGVDETIAKFFVDRKIPANNRYWKDRYLYVAKGTGFLFIPLYFDLQYKCGVSLTEVLNEDYVKLMEEILNSAALYEFGEISFENHLGNCRSIMSNNIKNEILYDELSAYFNDEQLKPYKSLGTNSRALNRGDTLLFSLCYLDIDAVVTEKIIKSWYALVPSFLLMDDIYDLKEDTANNEENAIHDFGPGSDGILKAIEFCKDKFRYLKIYNDKLGWYFETLLDKKLQTPYMQSLLVDN